MRFFHPQFAKSAPRLRRGMSIVEVTIATLIISVMMVSVLRMVAVAKVTNHRLTNRTQALPLAEEMMAEILATEYADPDAASFFGLEFTQGEMGGPGRTLYDDVDDFVFWSKTPPQRRDGTLIPGMNGWTRSVFVAWVDPDDYSQIRIFDTGCKKITVSMKRGAYEAVTLEAIRTSGWPTARQNTKLLFVTTPNYSYNYFTRGYSMVPNNADSETIELIKTWGFKVTIADSTAPSVDVAASISANDVVYISGSAQAKLIKQVVRDATVGVVIENSDLIESLNIGREVEDEDGRTINITNVTHPITSGFGSTGTKTITNSKQKFVEIEGSLASGAQVMGVIEDWDERTLVIVDKDGLLLDNSPAKERRVVLPWANDNGNFRVSYLHQNGKDILKRAIEWAANQSE